jgi:hypothetical protein
LFSYSDEAFSSGNRVDEIDGRDETTRSNAQIMDKVLVLRRFRLGLLQEVSVTMPAFFQ